MALRSSKGDGSAGSWNRGTGKADFNAKRKKKVAEIHQALNSDPTDVAALRRMAISEGGLLTDEIRCQVWPKLLNVNSSEPAPESRKDLRHMSKDYQQVLLDVRRSLRRFPPGMPDEQREGLQEELIDIILLILDRNPQLHYYQGYHDIVVTFLLVVGERLATSLVEKLSTHHLRDFMDPTMDNTKHILNYLMPIIDQVNPELHDFMQSAEVGTIFALSWLITWFGHVLSDFRLCCTGSRKSWTVTVTWPLSTTCCPRSLRTCPMRRSSAEPETSLFSFPLRNLQGRRLRSRRLKERRPLLSKTLSWPRPSRGQTWCCGSGFGDFCGLRLGRKMS
ncbi:TBC1 domain family member 20 isoform X4 [Peromyscus eremicus]|uniref:TBC1 domain family member 20 isoform X4 n=1 Tax=Peromyscus eremicus TaxID=42410 RepID=UPI0027DD8853|nr:TBC1 domain family member 20 isoform X4 [Peromyscus eremicus]